MTRNSFIEGMEKESSITYTENGAKAVKTTGEAIIDIFGTIGAVRGRGAKEVEVMYEKAFVEEPLLALKLLFYARNIRGGLGERATARVLFKYLANTRPDVMRKNILHIPHYGRWDDLYSLVGTPLESDMWELLKCQLDADLSAMKRGESVSMLGKWLKSANASSAETKELGRMSARKFSMSEKEYRKTLKSLREHLAVVETKMSKGEWDKIKYSGVTSQAMTRYRNAFWLRDPEGFESYLESLSKGEEKINASTLYPYNIVEGYGAASIYSMETDKPDMVLEEQWKALPNYVDGEQNVVVMADTSGSMYGRPLATALGLAVYFAERNTGPYKDKFMTFSESPKFVTLKGDSLYARLRGIESIIANTNIERAFGLILDTAVKNKVKPCDMPKALVVVSDMEFDCMVESPDKHNTYYEAFAEMYRVAGYEMPTVVFWNVDSRQDIFHAESGKKGVLMVSGQSASTFQTVLRNIGKTPYEAVVDTLLSEEYARIIL